MTLARHAKRRDANEKPIVAALRKIGCNVWYIDEPCDLVVCSHGVLFFMEVKDGSKKPSARKLTPGQQVLQDLAGVNQVPFVVVTSIDEALLAAREFGR